MKDKSKLVEEMVNKISNESTKKIAENINLDKINLSDKKLVFSKIQEHDKDIASKLEIIYKNSNISSVDELKQHILNIIKIRAINRTRRIDLGKVDNNKELEWKKLELLVDKIVKIYAHYNRLPKSQQDMIDESIDNVKKQLLMMSIKEQDTNNILIKDSVLKKIANLKK